MYNKKKQIKTGLECPLCGEEVVIAVDERSFSGYSEIGEMPEGALFVGHRSFRNGTKRCYYRFPGTM